MRTLTLPNLAGLTLLSAALFCAPQSPTQGEITVEVSKRHQTVDGFGTCLPWWEEVPHHVSSWVDLYYRDLGASMLRVEMVPYVLTADGRGKLDSVPVPLGESLEANIARFDFKHPTLHKWGVMGAAGKRRSHDDFKLIGSLWTPPHWLKEGAEIEDNNSSGGSLKTDAKSLQQFARYVAAYVKGFEKEYGVPFYAVSIQNELKFETYYNSCTYEKEAYVSALKAVSAEFDRLGIETLIQGPEDVGVGSPEDPWLLARQFEYINAVNADPGARAALDIYSIHGYAEDGSTAGGSREMWRRYWDGNVPGAPTDLVGVKLMLSSYMRDRAHPAAVPGIARDHKRSWMTEASGDKPGLDGALSVAGQIHDALVYGHVSAWLYWQFDHTSEETHNLVDAEDPPGKKFQAVRHFSRYVRPGAVRVSATPDALDGVAVSAWIHDENQTLTAVLINRHDDARAVRVHVAGEVKLASLDAWRTSESESFTRLEKLDVEKGRVALEMPARSIVTLHGRAGLPSN